MRTVRYLHERVKPEKVIKQLGVIFFAQDNKYISKRLYCRCGGKLSGLDEGDFKYLECANCGRYMVNKEVDDIYWLFINDVI